MDSYLFFMLYEIATRFSGELKASSLVATSDGWKSESLSDSDEGGKGSRFTVLSEPAPSNISADVLLVVTNLATSLDDQNNFPSGET